MKNQYQLVLFDVDSTLIEQEVIDLLANRTPHGAQVADITRRAMSGEIDFDGAFAKESHFFEDFQNLPIRGTERNYFLAWSSRVD